VDKFLLKNDTLKEALTAYKNIKMNKFDFLTSTRFWALVIGAVAVYLQHKGIIGEPEMVLIGTLTTVFIGVKTIDRSVEKLAERD